MKLGVRTLTELDLSNAHIGYRGALVLSKHINQHKTPILILNSLLLSGNGIGDLGVLALGVAIKVCMCVYVVCICVYGRMGVYLWVCV